MSEMTQSQHVVGVADMLVIRADGGRITTHALGSCIGVTLFDAKAGVGGLLHYMLPEPHEIGRGESRPAMFASTGIPAFFRAAYGLGASKASLVICVAGGSTLLKDSSGFQIGKRNHTLLRKLFFKNNVVVAAEDVGGSEARTMSLDLATGITCVRIRGEEQVLWSRSKSA